MLLDSPSLRGSHVTAQASMNAPDANIKYYKENGTKGKRQKTKNQLSAEKRP